MSDNFYKQLIEKSPIGYAYHRIIFDNIGEPCDCEVIEVNEAFEFITCLKQTEIIGKRLTKILKYENEQYYFRKCLDAAINGTNKELEHFCKILNRWFKIYLYSPKEGYLVTYIKDISVEKVKFIELETSLKRMENFLEGTNVGTWELNLLTGEIVHNERWAEIFGYTLEELSPIDKDTWRKFVHPDDLLQAFARDEELYNKKIEYYDDEYRMKHKNGNWVWVNDRGKVISWSEDGKPLLISGTHTDITERKRAEEALKDSEQKYRLIFEHNPLGIIHFDKKGKITNCNEKLSKIIGVKHNCLVGFDLTKLHDSEFTDALIISLKGNQAIYEGEYKSTNLNKNVPIRVIFDPIYSDDNDVVGGIGIVEDISDKKKKQEEIIYLSYRDQLTGLYNRRFYEEELKRLDVKRNLPLTLVMADVNGLKLINDSFGHALGDELLKKVAHVLEKGCRSDDIIARLGGDEFVIILTKTDYHQAEQIIKRINNFAQDEKVGSFDISISFGYETKYNETHDILDIFKNAEDYMYRHKLYESSSIRNKTIDIIMNTLYEKSNREMLHSKRVSDICGKIAISMNIDKDNVNQIKIAGLMHDIGKMGIDEKILNKPEALNSDEWKEMRRHPEIGYRILSSSNEFSEISEYVLKHHERWDGKGYPGGFKGYEISLQARIIAVADAYDAMTSDRPYRKRLSIEEAIMEMRRCSGSQFDPSIVDVFIKKVLKK